MKDMQGKAEALDPIEGADAAGLGLTGTPETAPPGAEVETAEHLVPGATFADRPNTDAKPWQTSLAAESDQAGVANDPPDAQSPAYPNPAVTRAEDETDPR